MKIDHKQARILFKRYKECQRKRSKGECKSVAVQSSSCENCPSYGQPRLPNLYGWFSNTPCVAWHSHVTSRYGNLDLLSRPSVVDSRAVAKLISLKNLPILGEMITCTSENGEQRTELYALPTAGVFDKQGERTRLSLN